MLITGSILPVQDMKPSCTVYRLRFLIQNASDKFSDQKSQRSSFQKAAHTPVFGNTEDCDSSRYWYDRDLTRCTGNLLVPVIEPRITNVRAISEVQIMVLQGLKFSYYSTEFSKAYVFWTVRTCLNGNILTSVVNIVSISPTEL